MIDSQTPPFVSAGTIEEDAEGNLAFLKNNQYCGRLIMQGRVPDGNVFQMIVITVRSEANKNRLLVSNDADGVQTTVADHSKPFGNPKTTIYNAMVKINEHYIVGNGDHIDEIASEYGGNTYPALADSLDCIKYEPDPSSTSRIAAIFSPAHLSLPSFQFAQIMKSLYDDTSNRFYYEQEDIPQGYAFCLCTYAGDAAPDDPLCPMDEKPFIIKVDAVTVEQLLEFGKSLVNPKHYVSCAARIINEHNGDDEISIDNRFEYVKG